LIFFLLFPRLPKILGSYKGIEHVDFSVTIDVAVRIAANESHGNAVHVANVNLSIFIHIDGIVTRIVPLVQLLSSVFFSPKTRVSHAHMV